MTFAQIRLRPGQPSATTKATTCGIALARAVEPGGAASGGTATLLIPRWADHHAGIAVLRGLGSSTTARSASATSFLHQGRRRTGRGCAAATENDAGWPGAVVVGKNSRGSSLEQSKRTSCWKMWLPKRCRNVRQPPRWTVPWHHGEEHLAPARFVIAALPGVFTSSPHRSAASTNSSRGDLRCRCCALQRGEDQVPQHRRRPRKVGELDCGPVVGGVVIVREPSAAWLPRSRHFAR